MTTFCVVFGVSLKKKKKNIGDVKMIAIGGKHERGITVPKAWKLVHQNLKALFYCNFLLLSVRMHSTEPDAKVGTGIPNLKHVCLIPRQIGTSDWLKMGSGGFEG